MVPNPEFTPRNTSTGVFEFWRLAGPKETRSGIFYSPFHPPAAPGLLERTPLEQREQDGRKEEGAALRQRSRDACLHLVVTKPPLAALLLCVGE